MANRQGKQITAGQFRIRVYLAVMIRVVPKVTAEALFGAVLLAAVSHQMFGHLEGMALIPPLGFAIMHVGFEWWRAHRVAIDRIEHMIHEEALKQDATRKHHSASTPDDQ